MKITLDTEEIMAAVRYWILNHVLSEQVEDRVMLESVRIDGATTATVTVTIREAVPEERHGNEE